ncbi:MAG: hypothetical protein AAF804_03955 [Bacteroidota bacterium]
MNRTWLWLGLCLGLLACGPPHKVSRSFDDGCWPSSDTLSFDYQTGSSPVKAVVDLTLQSDFATQNIFLKLRYGAGDKPWREVLWGDTLMSPEGEWLTDVNGDKVKWTMSQGPVLALDPEQSYQFQLYHFMRDSLVCAVREVGLRLVE